MADDSRLVRCCLAWRAAENTSPLFINSFGLVDLRQPPTKHFHFPLLFYGNVRFNGRGPNYLSPRVNVTAGPRTPAVNPGEDRELGKEADEVFRSGIINQAAADS